MQDVSDVPLGRAPVRLGQRSERLTLEAARAQAGSDRLPAGAVARELLDTRFVRAELMRLRRPPGAGGGSAASGRAG